jgi:type II secretory pathway pseudopilin PulG
MQKKMENSAIAKRQRGMSLVGLIFVGLIVVALLALGFKLVPAMVEYIAIERAVQKIRNEASTVRDIQAAFDRHATIDDITSISSRDLDITKEGERIVISYAYQKKIPILDNVSLVIDFSGTTKDRQRKDIP